MLKDVFINVNLPDNGGTVRVELLRVPSDEDKLLCKMCAFATEGKDTETIPTDEWLNDRQNKYDRRKAPQDAPVTMIWSMEAEELMIVFNKRLCAMADIATRTVVEAMRSLVLPHAAYMHGLMVPMCEYHGGTCHEDKGCGKAVKA